MYRAFLLSLLIAGATYAKVWHVSSSGTGTRTDGTSWAEGGSITLDTLGAATLTAGDTIYIRADGTHTLHASIDKSASDGAATTPYMIIGVLAATTNTGSSIVSSDWALGDTSTRPLIDLQTYQLKVGGYYFLKYLRFQGSAASMVYLEARGGATRCQFNQNYNTGAARQALYTLGTCKVIDCIFTSANCSGLTTGSNSTVKYCVFKHMVNSTGGIGFLTSGDNIHVEYCLFDSCRIGISTANRDNLCVENCTFKKCPVAVSGTTDYAGYFDNNVIDSSTTDGFYFSTQTNSNIFRGNHGNDTRNNDMWDGVDETGIFRDIYVTTGDPLFKTRTNFSLQAGSPCLNTAKALDTLWAK